jgi:SWI/SNF-related matrix-associated actin-dependent regulator 1 of chromatin subfamily A
MKQLYPFQLEAVEKGINKNLVIADEPGLGKTVQGLHIALGVLETVSSMEGKRPYKHVLIVCPKSVRFQWIKELEECGLPSFVVDATTRKNKNEINLADISITLFVVTHYEILRSSDYLLSNRWACVILDEVHRIKNKNTKTAASALRLQAYRKVGLTGTPMDKSPAELWSVLNWMNKRRFSSYWSFFRSYVRTQDIYVTRTDEDGREYAQTIQKPIGVKNEIALQADIAPYFIRREKKDVAPQLPELIWEEAWIELPENSPQRKLYKKVLGARDMIIPEEELINLIDDFSFAEELQDWDGYMADGDILIHSLVTRYILLQRVLSDPLSVYEKIELSKEKQKKMSSAKLDYLLERITKDEPESVFIVFTKFRSTAYRIRDTLLENLVSCVLAIGGQSVNKREEQLQKFLSGEVRALVGTYGTISEGLNLQMADTVYFFDVEMSTIKEKQAQDRVHRITVTDNKRIVRLLALDSLDEDLLRGKTEKLSTVQIMMELMNG